MKSNVGCRCRSKFTPSRARIGAFTWREMPDKSLDSAGTSCTSIFSPKRSDTHVGSLPLLASSTTSAVPVAIRPSAGSPEISSGTISAAVPTRGISVTATMAPVIENGLRPMPRRESLAMSVAQGSRTSGSATKCSSSSAALLDVAGVPQRAPANRACLRTLHALEQRDDLGVLQARQRDASSQQPNFRPVLIGVERALDRRLCVFDVAALEAGVGAVEPLLGQRRPFGFARSSRRTAARERYQKSQDGSRPQRQKIQSGHLRAGLWLRIQVEAKGLLRSRIKSRLAPGR